MKKENSKIEELNAFSDQVLVIDTETTGLGEDAEILQLAVITGGGDLIVNDKFRPEHTEQWPSAMKVNHITPEDVKFCPSFKEKIDEYKPLFSGEKIICGYNVRFDLHMLENNGIIFPELRIRDVMDDFTRISPNWCKLTECADFFGWESSEADRGPHDALYDCEMTRFAAVSMLSRGVIRNSENLKKFPSTPVCKIDLAGELKKTVPGEQAKSLAQKICALRSL